MASTQTDLLRKLIREEVALAVRTEIKLLMNELKPILEGTSTPSKPISSRNSLVESIKSTTKIQPKSQYVSTGNPIVDLLNETKQAMQPDEYRSIGNFEAQDAQGFGAQAMSDFGPKQTMVVEDMSSILQASRPASDVSGVQLADAVPDYTGLMKSLKEKGAI